MSPVTKGHRVVTAILFLFVAISFAIILNLPDNSSEYLYITTLENVDIGLSGENLYEQIISAQPRPEFKLREWSVTNTEQTRVEIGVLWEAETVK